MIIYCAGYSIKEVWVEFHTLVFYGKPVIRFRHFIKFYLFFFFAINTVVTKSDSITSFKVLYNFIIFSARSSRYCFSKDRNDDWEKNERVKSSFEFDNFHLKSRESAKIKKILFKISCLVFVITSISPWFTFFLSG